MSNETKHFILTINGTQKFLIVSRTDDFDAQMWKWLEEGNTIYADELRIKSITEEKFELTGKGAIIILKNAVTLSWEGAESVGDAWVVA